MVASMNVSQIRLVPVGSAKPRVNSDDPLTSNDRCNEPAPAPQKMRVKLAVTRSIHTRGRLTRAIGA